MNLKGKKILLGISGGIAAYKCCELVRLYKKSGAEVKVIMTPSALNFVSPVTLSALSGNEVMINLFPEVDPNRSSTIETKTWHIYTGLWADIFVIAPATANTIAKIVHGISDNFLTSTVLSARSPVLISPAMDEDMYLNEATVRNVSALRELGYIVIEPESGELASGLSGIGRLPEAETIFQHTVNVLNGGNRDLEGKKILITAGPTYEPIDDVRFIGNYSSGKMGFSLALAAMQRGADVKLVTGPVSLKTPRHVTRIDVNTAEEMLNAVKDNLKGNDIVIMSAAVADYKPKSVHTGKLKKSGNDNLAIETERTVDILEYAGKNNTGFKLIGFALETENEIEYALDKIKRKDLDMIVVNNPKVEGAGFKTDTNVITIIDKNGNKNEYPKMTKFEAAGKIIDHILGV
ncbi:MAG TPA: bifunctional phosphopantothenoylcysteine decarboxylase/phosphopantothenate--cysteine ligase CoaBC [Ignavibacteria bacterium]|nr:bifunctional phosphopantothenoylcysteine decarboxylase/phosphopantothenate--cysteine ligase CoaBC [Ignavibacteria bacterium]HRF67143.1 bifunctional phosphopantothenoylcysteine decarboxylase/phosphopantothenate--cysteine ligase CoaBC [Ignavibacteria bacterium]HRJ04423.1 bifunctional phosphopantothenoylcysteine decarboxylase/phosphopantothenate--cysteine ligase CoaBC [Ignavibacteria bacterium]